MNSIRTLAWQSNTDRRYWTVVFGREADAFFRGVIHHRAVVDDFGDLVSVELVA